MVERQREREREREREGGSAIGRRTGAAKAFVCCASMTSIYLRHFSTDIPAPNWRCWWAERCEWSTGTVGVRAFIVRYQSLSGGGPISPARNGPTKQRRTLEFLGSRIPQCFLQINVQFPIKLAVRKANHRSEWKCSECRFRKKMAP